MLISVFVLARGRCRQEGDMWINRPCEREIVRGGRKREWVGEPSGRMS